jgi:membrane protein DedA with SNARE-associated domain
MIHMMPDLELIPDGALLIMAIIGLVVAAAILAAFGYSTGRRWIQKQINRWQNSRRYHPKLPNKDWRIVDTDSDASH